MLINSRISPIFPLITVFFCVLAFLVTSPAQTKKPKLNKKTSAQVRAIDTLTSAAQEIPEIPDLKTQIDLAAQVVPLLAASRPFLCRNLLDKLFERVLEIPQKPENKTATNAPDRQTLARAIIRIAAGFDEKLTLDYLEKLTARSETDTNTNATKNVPPNRATAYLYLRTAQAIISHNPQFAFDLAQRAIRLEVLPETALVLADFRRQNDRLADALFLAAVQSITQRQGNNVNEIFTLYGYLFTPAQIPLVVDGQLGAWSYTLEPQPVRPALAESLVRATITLLSDTQRYTARLSQLTHGVTGDMYLLAAFKPQVIIYQPNSLPTLTAQEVFLANFLTAEQRDTIAATVTRANRNAANTTQATTQDPATVLAELLREAEETTNPTSRDRKYFHAASEAIRLLGRYEQALEIAGNISEATREGARNALLFHIAEDAAKKNKPDDALGWARKVTAKASQAYLFNLIAASLADAPQPDLAKTTESLLTAEYNARQMAKGQEKLSILSGLAVVYARFDPSRAAELLREVITTANSVEQFTGNTAIYASVTFGDFGFFYEMYSKELSFTDLIKAQGRNNFDATLTDLQSLTNRVARLNAILGLCRNTLASEKQPRQTQER